MRYFRLLVSLLFISALCQTATFAQPGFEDYVFEPQVSKAGISEAEYHADPKAFRARYFPKLGIPVRRGDYFGVWNWFNHGSYPSSVVYDNDRSKKTYFFCRTRGSECGHNAVDWLVGYRNYGANEVVNPFPSGATVKVTSYVNSHPDSYSNNNLGNYVELTCYLDGNPDNDDKVNRLIVKLSHLKMGSISVRTGDFVNSGQTLGQVGFSGSTSFTVMHTHVTYKHMDVDLDPFDGSKNWDLNESMLFNQRWIESITNWDQRENGQQLTVNNAFSITVRNKRTNVYTFRANNVIEHIRVEDRYGNIIPDLDVLENPDLEDLRFSSHSYTRGDGQTATYHEVSFRWYQDADAGTLYQDMPFRIETDYGQISNRVFIKVVP